jgi:type I restriction enzyme S subunit
MNHEVVGFGAPARCSGWRAKWLGDYPRSWSSTTLGKVARVCTGGTPDRNRREFWDDGRIPWMSSGEVNLGQVCATEEKITPAAVLNSNAKVLPVNRVMLALNGQGKTKGTAAILRIPAACNQSLAAIVCDEKRLHHRYLFYYLVSRYRDLRGLVGDEQREGLNLFLVKSLPVYLPRCRSSLYLRTFWIAKSQLSARQSGTRSGCSNC